MIVETDVIKRDAHIILAQVNFLVIERAKKKEEGGQGGRKSNLHR